MTGLEDQEFDFDFLFEFNQSDEGAAAAAPGGSARGRGSRAEGPGRGARAGRAGRRRRAGGRAGASTAPAPPSPAQAGGRAHSVPAPGAAERAESGSSSGRGGPGDPLGQRPGASSAPPAGLPPAGHSRAPRRLPVEGPRLLAAARARGHRRPRPRLGHRVGTGGARPLPEDGARGAPRSSRARPCASAPAPPRRKLKGERPPRAGFPPFRFLFVKTTAPAAPGTALASEDQAAGESRPRRARRFRGGGPQEPPRSGRPRPPAPRRLRDPRVLPAWQRRCRRRSARLYNVFRTAHRPAFKTATPCWFLTHRCPDRAEAPPAPLPPSAGLSRPRAAGASSGRGLGLRLGLEGSAALCWARACGRLPGSLRRTLPLEPIPVQFVQRTPLMRCQVPTPPGLSAGCGASWPDRSALLGRPGPGDTSCVLGYSRGGGHA